MRSRCVTHDIALLETVTPISCFSVCALAQCEGMAYRRRNYGKRRTFRRKSYGSRGMSSRINAVRRTAQRTKAIIYRNIDTTDYTFQETVVSPSFKQFSVIALMSPTLWLPVARQKPTLSYGGGLQMH